ncbi:MAG: hypothetical protein DPW11_00495 [bacterium]|nr:hypothetical protein [Candidatus Microgenomates bacterium CPR3]MCQ3944247.1 hypothetical protein [bacterium]RIK52075.1 MAG: hypothetical protein DCC61_00700 [Candidatus Microgenomates bacterium]
MSPYTSKPPLFIALTVLVLATATLACTFSAGPNGVSLDTSDTPATVPAPEATAEAPVANDNPAQPANSAYCGQARDLGPWAPSNGAGETYEVTASNDSAGIVLDVWFPGGVPETVTIGGQKVSGWGKKEITTFIPTGLSVDVVNGAGRGWDYESSCLFAEVQRQMQAHMSQRMQDTSYFSFVSVDDLIANGLLRVRFDRRVAP